MEAESNQSSIIDTSRNIEKNTKKSIIKLIKNKKSSNLVISVINASRKYSENSRNALNRKNGEVATNNDTREEKDENSSTYDSNFDIKIKTSKEDPIFSKNLIGFEYRSGCNVNTRNEQALLKTECDGDNDSIILNTEKLDLNADAYKFFMTNDNMMAEDLKNSGLYGSQGLMYTDRNFMIEKADLDDGEYIYDDCIKILDFIAEGAQAKIYLGLIEEIDKYVAVKRMNIKYDKVLLEKIESECEMVKKLEHPNILKYFDIEVTAEEYEEDEDVPPAICNIDIIMEFIDGFNLKELVKKEGTIPMEKIKFITQKILEGLLYLHENKIIHRDLKVR